MNKGRAGRGGKDRNRTNAGGDRNVVRYGGIGATDGYVLSLLILLLSGCLFSTEYNTKRGGMGRERRGGDYVLSAPSSGGRGGDNEYVSCHFLFSTLFLSSSHSSSFPLSTVQRRAELGGT